MSDTPTPLTDALVAASKRIPPWVWLNHAHRMERDRALLLAAVERISELLIRPNDYELNEARNAARAALAKARGE